MPSTNFVLLDKELCFAEFLGINPIIVINKTDLDEENADEIAKIYINTGYKVIKIKAELEEGMEQIAEILKNNTTVLAGSSGVRKINNNK